MFYGTGTSRAAGGVNQTHWLDIAWLLFWGVLSSVWCVTAAQRLSATFDEPYNLNAGLESWQTGSFKRLVDTGKMPLPIWLETAPLHFWEQWRGKPIDLDSDIDAALLVARTTALVFWWLLLWYGWVAGRQLAGPWGGRLAVLFLACEPSLLAHAFLVTGDLAVAACLLALFVHYRLGRPGGWWLRVGVPALWLAAAVLSKASGMVFGLLGMAILEIEYRLRDRTDLSGWRERARAAPASLCDAASRRQLAQAFWIGLALVFVFCGSDWRASPSFVKWANQLPDTLVGDSMRWLSTHLCIFSNAGNGIAYQLRANFMTQPSFLLGEVHPRAVWYYFPVALSIKLTIPLLVLPFVLVWLAPRSLWNWSCVLAGLLFLFTLNCRIQRGGVRYVTPLVVMAAVGLTAALVRAAREAPAPWRRRTAQLLTIALPIWLVWAACSVWPHGLCYVNELWGGPGDGYKLLAESNYDWGQGVKELLAWQRRHDAGTIDVVYIGTDPRVLHPPFHLVPDACWQPEALRGNVRGRYLAVGTTFLYSITSIDKPYARQLIEWLRESRPVARTTTFLVYDLCELSPGEPSRVSGRLTHIDLR